MVTTNAVLDVVVWSEETVVVLDPELDEDGTEVGKNVSDELAGREGVPVEGTSVDREPVLELSRVTVCPREFVVVIKPEIVAESVGGCDVTTELFEGEMVELKEILVGKLIGLEFSDMVCEGELVVGTKAEVLSEDTEEG